MKNSEFANFKKIIANATENDDIWWRMYLFLDLTEKQANDLIPIVKRLPYFKTSDDGKNISFRALTFHPTV